MLRFVLLAVSLVPLASCAEPPAPPPLRPVRAIKVGDADVMQGRSLPGRAEPTAEVNLSFRVAGPLVQLPAEAGMEVQEGDLLAQIDPRDFRLALDNARANLERAQQNLQAMQSARPEDIRLAEQRVAAAKAQLTEATTAFNRNKELLAANAIAKSEYDRSESTYLVSQSQLAAAEEELIKLKAGARVEDVAAMQAEIRSLQAAVATSENQLEYTSLLAPFTGTVSVVFVENFQTVQAKQAIVRVVDTSRIEVTINIPERGMPMLQYCRDLTCLFDVFPEKPFQARVKEVGTEASSSTRTFPVTVEMDQQYADEGIKVLPGMAARVSARVELPDTISEGVVVPESAVFSEGDTKSVWVIDETTNRVRKQPVTVGDLTPYGLRVSGLATGQWIATAGVHHLNEGQEVRLLDAQ